MMKQYDSYKDSGVEWIGKIPSHWGICRIKNILKQGADSIKIGPFGSSLTGRVGANLEYKVYGQWNIVGADFNAGTNTVNKETFDELSKSYKVISGDILVSMMGTIGKCAVIPEGIQDGIMDSHVVKIRLNDSIMLGSYFEYIYDKDKSNVIFNQLQKMKGGSIMDGLNSTIIKSLTILVPPLSEQQTLVCYLDKKCGKIDKAIATQEKRVELLKELRQNIITQAVTRGINPNAPLKDSGVEWIGEVPEHWEMKRIKHVCNINGRVGYRGYTTADLVPEGEGAYTIGGKHISNNVLDLTDAEYISWEKYYESPEIMVKAGDIVTAQRGSLGKTAIVRDEIGEATINPSLVLLNHISIYNEFLYWYLVSTPALIAIELLNTSTAVPMVSQWQISNINIPVPPLSEQQEIVSYIESKSARLDASIEKAEHQIELLQELKQSIITEVVTGKRKVC